MHAPKLVPGQVLDPCLGEVSDGELAAFCELAGACLQHDGWRRPRMTEAGALLGQICALHAGGPYDEHRKKFLDNVQAVQPDCSSVLSWHGRLSMLRCRCLRCGSLVSRQQMPAACLAGEIPAEPRQRSPPTPRQGPQVARPASRVTPTSSNEVCPAPAHRVPTAISAGACAVFEV